MECLALILYIVWSSSTKILDRPFDEWFAFSNHAILNMIASKK